MRELLPGCFLLQPKMFADQRGCFIKTYHDQALRTLGISMEIREEFFSISHKNVLRGMHFQTPPHDHDKLVYCTQGAALDVLLDLRKGENFGKSTSAELSANNRHIVFIPKGIAHGFLSLSDDTLMMYKTSTIHMPESDCGILWNSFGFDWGIDNPVISERDKQHRKLNDYITPF
ncbi:dTDP-4-dehydrorhamnose 3,5-epimerase [Crenobacter sp. SG2305]|uniref:dTDP-4-dehydrorhamnose 3,5-epimerase n=1 Tax=Crenobacter oryzisoli TaxID=3056844 RepID=UPI0025AB50ED|nr:dTDP-4-dehydrorhamnose 3,5-epimerase [Crenobacter sp. SG2305]MDN0084264.1 dTDP-4-dehydrorhamnose 3,5-epimerase [Crenobacter sp. SG2305]